MCLNIPLLYMHVLVIVNVCIRESLVINLLAGNLINMFKPRMGCDECSISSSCPPAMDKYLEEFVFSNKWPKDLVIWLRRTFYSDTTIDPAEASFANFVDVAAGRLNEVAQARLKTMSDRLADKINAENKLDSQVKWIGGGISSEIKEHGEYLEKLGTDYKEMLMKKVTEEISRKEEYDVRCKKAIHRGMCLTISSIL